MEAPILRMGGQPIGLAPIPYVVEYPRAGIPSFTPAMNPTTAARTAKHMTAVVFHPEQSTRKGDHPWLT
jgi:hypothetical protein